LDKVKSEVVVLEVACVYDLYMDIAFLDKLTKYQGGSHYYSATAMSLCLKHKHPHTPPPHHSTQPPTPTHTPAHRHQLAHGVMGLAGVCFQALRTLKRRAGESCWA